MEILTAVKGSEKEKRLASQFIARFFKHFPHLADQAIEAQIDLCEDEDQSVSYEILAQIHPASVKMRVLAIFVIVPLLQPTLM